MKIIIDIDIDWNVGNGMWKYMILGVEGWVKKKVLLIYILYPHVRDICRLVSQIQFKFKS